MSDETSRFTIEHGDVRIEDPWRDQSERDAHIAKIIELASEKLTAAGLGKLLPFFVTTTRRDDDRFHFLHVASGFLPEGRDGAFHFAIPRKRQREPGAEAERLSIAAQHYLRQQEQLIREASNMRDQLLGKKAAPGFEVLEIAALVDVEGNTRLSAEMVMLEFDLVPSRCRRVAHSASDLTAVIDEAHDLHLTRLIALRERSEAGCDIFVDETAQLVLDICGLSAQKVTEILDGAQSLDVAFTSESSPYSIATFSIDDGVLFADLRDADCLWELQGRTMVIPSIPDLPMTVRTAS